MARTAPDGSCYVVTDPTAPLDIGTVGSVGTTTDSPPGTDTGTGTVIGVLKRVAQNITSLIGKFPSALGGTTGANSFPVVLASDDAVSVNLGAKADSAASTDTGTFSLIALIKKVAQNITSMSGKLPTTIGTANSAGSLSVVLSSDHATVQIKGNLAVFEFTPTLDTSAYQSGDILFTTTAVTSVFDANGGSGLLTTVVINDKDDQGIAMDVLFLRANTSLGTINNAPSISDAGADDIIGKVSISAADYVDLGGTRVAFANVPQVLKTGAGTTSLWVAGITRGAPTHTASGLVIKFGIADKT